MNCVCVKIREDFVLLNRSFLNSLSVDDFVNEFLNIVSMMELYTVECSARNFLTKAC